MPVWDYGFYMQFVCAGLLEENRKIIRFFKRIGLDEVGYIVAVLWGALVVMAYSHHYGLFSWISVIMTIQFVWKYSVSAIILLHKGEWNWRRWYYESLSKAHIMPYARMGIKL